ncbi:ankyrin repeat-containing protein BDA1-like [Cucurbita moschata]|uniref:Ankyrin repeat-containing protein BDA1-like n=1 Tax=Cucurbita moschata TaxID=3662 RepID=A0A6J1EUP0_CUCMO|nr:ankyrin repeat-containing protein BDA1-like [Cucurbita moschata]XP_022931782.1 ankyrin repeat-containing protein BDA1-like [Cucurbita moschata]
MNQRLNEVASSGDIDSLYLILQEDAYILERIDQVPFVDTPLHISASAGHVPFSLEIMRLKPSLAKKLNPEGYTPIHLALQNNQTKTVLRLVDIDRDLVSIQGREGLTPLHIAASGGMDDILAKFLTSCPKSIKELTIRNESALHIAIKNEDIESVKILLQWIQKTCMASILNWCDDEGNNAMHLAALENQIEMVKLLINKVDMKAKNLEGKTALDIMKEHGLVEDKEVKEMLHGYHILKDIASFLRTISLILKRLVITDHREIHYISKEDRNAILVVSVLIATATYQAALTPPNKDGDFFIRQYKWITYQFFVQFNTLAFVASAIEICLHLPSGIDYALHLVIPLVICYALLAIVWCSYLSSIITIAIIFVLILSKIPLVRRKVKGDFKPKKLRKLGGLFMRSISMEKELTEISLHFGRTG